MTNRRIVKQHYLETTIRDWLASIAAAGDYQFAVRQARGAKRIQ